MANKPTFDGNFTITDVENLSNQWDHFPFPNSKAIAFNGVNAESLVAVAGPASDLSFGNATADLPFSLCAWVKPDVALGGVEFGIAGHGDYATCPSCPGYNFFLNTFHRVGLQLRDNGTAAANSIKATETVTSVTPGQWNHVCVTYPGGSPGDPANISVYVNGVGPKGTTLYTGAGYVAMHPATEDFTIGRKYANLLDPAAGGSNAQGLIDELAVFNKELSAGEVAEIYNSGFVFDLRTFSGVANLVSWWRMGDKATGTSPNFTIPDQIGSNDAVMTAFLGDSTSGIAPGAPEEPEVAGAIPVSLATKGIVFHQRNKPYLVSRGSNPDDIIT